MNPRPQRRADSEEERAASRTVRRAMVAHTLYYMAGRSLPAVLFVVSIPVFIRAMGAEQYGVYALYSALALVVGNTAGAWMAQPVLRYASRFAQDPSGAYGAALWIGSAGVVLLAAVLAGAFGTLLPGGAALPATATVAAGSTALFAVVYAQEQAMLRAVKANLLEIVRVLVAVGVPLAALLLGTDLSPVALLGYYAAGNLVAAALAMATSSDTRPVRSHRTRVYLTRMVAFGAPVALWMLVSTTMNLADRYIIEWALGSAAVGLYASVYDIIYKGVLFAFTPMVMAAHPIVMREWNAGNEERALDVLARTRLVALGIGVVTVLGIWLLEDPLFTLITGESATGNQAAILAPVAAGAFVWQIGILTHKVLEMKLKMNAMLISALVALSVNLFINFVFVNTYGVLASAWATVVSSAVYLVFVFKYSLK
jgi:O-antigen/teichoic acid export membrane protein